MQQNKDLAPWEGLSGPNLAYVLEVYDEYLNDPNSVSEAYQAYFQKWGPPSDLSEQTSAQIPDDPSAPSSSGQSPAIDIRKASLAQDLVRNLREYGHLAAGTNPLQDASEPVEVLETEHYG